MEIPDKIEISRGFMKDCKPSFPRLLSGGGHNVHVAVTRRHRPEHGAQRTYGFVANAYQTDSSGQNGGALVGLMNFDGAGNVSGTFTIKPRNPNRNNTFAIRSDSFTGTYSSNPDGTISAKLAFFFGPVTFDMVATNGGQGLQFVSTDTYGGTSSQIRGSSLQSLGGGLPIKLFFPSANGSLPVSLRGVTAAAAGLPT